MPSIVTHNLFATEVKEQLTKRNILIKETELFLIFAQSFDNLFYYKFLTPWRGKKIRKLGNDAQQESTILYFENIINNIETKEKTREEQKAYLYGSICHYILDNTCHPYIFYHTGNPKTNKKYRGLHEKMEVSLDAYMLKLKRGKELKDETLANLLLPKISFSNELKNIIDIVFKNTFQIKNMGNIYEESVKNGNFLLKYFVTDKTGMKKTLYALKDIVTFWSLRRYKNLSFHVTQIDPEYLNLQKRTWYNPVDKSMIHNESFIELYNKALAKATKIIFKIEKYWANEITKEELLEIIGNNSYTTGLDCRLKREMKYFKI